MYGINISILILSLEQACPLLSGSTYRLAPAIRPRTRTGREQTCSILSLGQSKSNMGRPKGSKNRNKPVQEDSSSTLKMVLKLSAQEHAASSPASPSTSAVDSDEERSKSGTKRSRSSINKGTPSKVARKGKKMGWVMICVHYKLPLT